MTEQYIDPASLEHRVDRQLPNQNRADRFPVGRRQLGIGNPEHLASPGGLP
jgi:hypothetical protein